MKKVLDEKQLQAKADKAFAEFPDAKKVFVTSDGNAFLSENHAGIHAGKGGNVYPFDRKPEAPKATTEDDQTAAPAAQKQTARKAAKPATAAKQTKAAPAKTAKPAAEKPKVIAAEEKIKLIGEADTIEKLAELKKGEKRGSVLDTIEAKTTELTDKK